jgi:CHAD domain-containing protein
MGNSAASSENHLLKYFQLRSNNFWFWFEKTFRDFGVEDLHKLRVEIKKFRSFLRYVEMDDKLAFDKKDHYRLLSTIFKPGGALRETQMNLALLKRHRAFDLPGYQAYLTRRMEKQSVKLKASLDQFDSDLMHELNEVLLHELSLINEAAIMSNASSFINSELATMRKLRRVISNPKDLHQVRTHTKAMGYVARMIYEMYPTKKLESLLLPAKSAEKLIGNWHDRVVFRNSLLRYLKKNPATPEKDKIDRLLKQITYRNSVAVRHISMRLDGFINRRL